MSAEAVGSAAKSNAPRSDRIPLASRNKLAPPWFSSNFPTLGRLRYPRIAALAFSAAVVIAFFADFAPVTTSFTPIMKASWIGLDCG